MASANVELVRSVFAAWEHGDFSSADWADPEIEFVLADGPDPGSRTGRAEMAEGWRATLAAFEDYRLTAREYQEIDDGRVLVIASRMGRGKTSGVELDQVGDGAVLFCLRDGRVTRMVGYWEARRAFADLDLAPEAD